jgi:cell division protein FtsW
MSTTTPRRTSPWERPLASYQLVLGASALLLGLGLIMVLSASSIFARLNYGGNSFAIVERQLMFAVVGLLGAYAAAHIPLRILRKLILPFLIVSVLMILATFIPGVGIEVNGNRNWLPLVGGFRLQPSEFA